MGRAVLDPFHDFASEVENPLSSSRSKLFAVYHMLSPNCDPGDEILDAVRTLVAEMLESTDRMIELHGAAFRASQEARA